MTTMTAVLVLILACSGRVILQSHARRPCRSVSNGCSVPWFLGNFCRYFFVEACDIHDACYHCAGYYRVSQLQCDNAFRQNLRSLCRRNPNGCPTRRSHQSSRQGSLQERNATETAGAENFLRQSRGIRECYRRVQYYYIGVRSWFGKKSFEDSSGGKECHDLRHCMP